MNKPVDPDGFQPIRVNPVFRAFNSSCFNLRESYRIVAQRYGLQHIATKPNGCFVILPRWARTYPDCILIQVLKYPSTKGDRREASYKCWFESVYSIISWGGLHGETLSRFTRLPDKTNSWCGLMVTGEPVSHAIAHPQERISLVTRHSYLQPI